MKEQKDLFYVRKLSTGTVSYHVPGKTIKRKWKGKDARQKISIDELEESIYDPGIRTLYEGGYLYIEDKNARVDLGLEAPDGEEEEFAMERPLVLDRKGIVQLLYVEDFQEFKTKVEKLAKQTSELLVSVAIETPKHAGAERYDLLREKFGVDVEMLQRQKREESKVKEG